MSAYVIIDVAVSNPEKYEEYERLASPSVERFGGRYLARGGRAETLEGSWEPQRVVVIEFPSYERAKAWWGSDAYADAKALRQSVSEARMIVVDGS